jgi:hypothetical protein
MSQLKVMGLFGLVLVGMLFLDLDLGNKWLTMTVNSALVVVAFPWVIYMTKIEPEIVDYIDKVLATLRAKLSKKNG